MLPKISILIPAHNEEKMIGNTLENLLANKYPNKEIIVGVDNGSDNTLSIAKSFEKRNSKIIRVIHSKKRLGVTGIFNLMLSKASGSIIMKFDADMRIGNDRALFNLVKYFEKKEVGGIFYCGDRGFSDYSEIFKYVKDEELRKRIKKEREKSLTSRGENLLSRLVTEYKKSKLPIREIPDHPIDCHCFRREIIPKLDPKIIHDDAIFAYKILERGFDIEWAPDVVVIHLGVPTTSSHLFRQKVRGIVGWQDISDKYKLNLKKYYFQLFILFLKNIRRYKIKDIFAFFVWLNIFILSLLSSALVRKREPTSVWKPAQRT